MFVEIIDFGYTDLKVMPEYKHLLDVGADVVSKETKLIEPGTIETFCLGFGLKLPQGYMGIIMPRSGLASKGVISHIPPIDPGYTGEAHAFLQNCSPKAFQVTRGDRIGQLVVIKTERLTFVPDLNNLSTRGTDGLGSTGI